MISVCIAAYNDENTIEQIVMDSAKVFKELELNFEILVINDCSSDATGKILENLRPSLGFLKIITHNQNKGYGATIKELLYSSGGDIVFTLPGDLQIPPHVIKKMMPCIDECDIVIGRRRPRNDPLFRKINSAIYNAMINMLFHPGIKDINSTKLIKRSVIESVNLAAEGAFVDAELCARAVKNGFRIREVDIEHRKRLFGSPSGDRFGVMWDTFKEVFSMIGKV